MFASAASGLRALQRCARQVQWSAYPEGPYQPLRCLSACPISLSSSKDESASDEADSTATSSKGGGDSAPASGGTSSSAQIVDPAKDASLHDLFVIPIKKPLIPGASVEAYSSTCRATSGWLHHPALSSKPMTLLQPSPVLRRNHVYQELLPLFCRSKLSWLTVCTDVTT